MRNSFEQFESATTVPQSQTAEATLNKILSTAAASLSMVGTLIIIATFVIWHDLKTNSRRIIVFISIGDFSVACLNTVGLYNPPAENSLCEIQATLNVAAVLSSFFWTVYLSLYLYLTICRKISMASEKRVMMFFHITAWGLPLMIAIFAYFLNGVGYSRDMVSSGWCWVSTDQPWWKMLLWMCLTGKSWEIFAYLAISVFYVLVKQEVSFSSSFFFSQPSCHPLNMFWKCNLYMMSGLANEEAWSFLREQTTKRVAETKFS